MNAIRNIYFRSGLRSCNYHCSYCSFGRKNGQADHVNDQLVVNRFYTKIAAMNDPLRIMLIPYGEALIHDYFRTFMFELSRLPHIQGVSCQTNLSFSDKLFVKQITNASADIGKIKLWASYHPEMVPVDIFIRKVHYLYHCGIDICVGVVGHSSNKAIIGELRNKLDRRIYLFINEIQGSNEKLCAEDIDFYKSIDPFFLFDHKNAKADMKNCRGGKDTVFIDKAGNIHPCPRNPYKMGNLYSDTVEVPITPVCRNKRCDCYIAYSNLQNASLQSMMGNSILWRIPEKRKVKAIFFDIDGTLTDSKGMVPANYGDSLNQLYNEGISLYLSTALPLQHAKNRLGRLFSLFKGGVFADGAHLRYNGTDEYFPVDTVSEIDGLPCRIRSYTYKNRIYKYTMTFPTIEAANLWKHTIDQSQYRVTVEGRLLTLVHTDAGKQEGVTKICLNTRMNLKEVAAIGNTLHDWPMLSVTGYPCAVMTANDELQGLVKYVINPDHLSLFFTSL